MRTRGFSLVEVMVGIILSSLVLGGGYLIWSSARRDLSTASARQTIQHEVRLAMDQMTADFKSAKRGTFTYAKTGDTENISFHRFAEEQKADKTGSLQTYEVRYSWNPRTRTLERFSLGKTKYLSSNMVMAQIEQTDNTEAAKNSDDPAERGKTARVDIVLAAAKVVPGSAKIASHTEKTSVFIRDEYYSAVNKNKYISLASLTGGRAEDLKKNETNALLDSGPITRDMLKSLSTTEVRDVMNKEDLALREMQQRVTDINSQLGAIDTEGDRRWYTAWIWKPDSEFTEEQNRVKNHEDSRSLQDDKLRIEGKLAAREKDYINIATGQTGKEPTEFEKTAFDLKMKEWTMKKAHEESQKNKPAAERDPAPPSLMANFDPARIEKGITYTSSGERQTFSESDEAYRARREYAEKVHEAGSRIDIQKVNDREGEEKMRTYASGRDLLDMTEAKISSVIKREEHEANLRTIRDELSSRGER